MARVSEHIASLPVLHGDGIPETPQRLTLRLHSELAVATAEELDPQKILAFEQRLMSLADSIADRYFLRGLHGLRSDKLPAFS